MVETALEAFLKLVSKEGDGKTISLSNDFNLILEEAGVHKSFSLYKEKRFTHLAYQAGTIYDALPYFKILLDRTPLNNLLVGACRLYLECDFIKTGFKSLANFTFNVTMPYLNFVEKTDQDDLCQMLPELYRDRQLKRLDTLKEYQVPWEHVNMFENLPSSDLDHYLR